MKFLTSRVIVSAIASFIAFAIVPAIAAPTAADFKTVTSRAYVDSLISNNDISGHKVNGVPLSNASITLYGQSSTAANTAAKDVVLYDYSNPSNPTSVQMTKVVPGMVVVIKPDVTTTKLSYIKVLVDGSTINRSPTKYNGNDVSNEMAAKIWNANYPSVWLYDGTNWNFVAGGEDAGIESVGWNSSIHQGAIGAYSTTFDDTANNWPATDENRYIKGNFLANALALKQNKIAPNYIEFLGNNGNEPEYGMGLVTTNSSGNGITNGDFYVISNSSMSNTTIGQIGDGISAPLVNANAEFFNNNNLSSYYNSLDSFVPTVLAVGEALALKQSVLPATSDGTGNTPNYVHNASTNPTADGSVVTTTGTGGVVSQRGIATAPTRDNSGNLTNGSWLPTMSAVENMVSAGNISSHTVNGQALSNAQITFYGKSDSAANQARKQVTLYDYSDPSNPAPVQMDALVPGMVIVVQPDYTHSGNAAFVMKITNISNCPNVSARFNGGSGTADMAAKVWNANFPSVWLYDGDYWNFVAGGEDAGIRSVEWKPDVDPNAINAYSTTFGPGANNWYARDQYGFIDGNFLANALALKQNKITPHTNVFLDSGEPGLGIVTSNNNGNGITGENFYVISNYFMMLSDSLAVGDATMAPLVNANAEFFSTNNLSGYDSLDSFVPTVQAVGEALALKQSVLPAKDIGATAPIGNQAVILDTAGNPKSVYTTAGKNSALTAKSGAQMVMNYVDGTTASSTFASSQGLSETNVKAALVSLELLRDVYTTIDANKQQVIPGTGQYIDSNLDMVEIRDYTDRGVMGDEVVTSARTPGSVGKRQIFEAGATYTNNAATNIQIATIGAVMENTVTKRCAGYKPGTTTQNAANCWLWEFVSNSADSSNCAAAGDRCSGDRECCSGNCVNGLCSSIGVIDAGDGRS